MKVALYTLGCKVNQYETQAMEQVLRARGHQIVDFDGPAQAYVINTCSVTAVSDRKSRQMIRRVQQRCPGAVVAVCGCYVQAHPQEARRLGVHLLGGSADREAFVTLLESAAADKAPVEAIGCAAGRRTFERLPPGAPEGRTRAILKVEDGCNNFCSYCIIPHTRGPVRSLPLDQAVDQARQLKEQGFLEIVLTGIELASWGVDLTPRQELGALLRALSLAVPGVRLRLGSLEPRTVTEAFCRSAAAAQVCPQFHLSLQSGCDATLKRMNRRYDTKRYEASVSLLRQYFRRPAITTDLIVGFPGETEAEFEQTLAFIRRCGFARMHLFPYSVRPGTPAAKLPRCPRR